MPSKKDAAVVHAIGIDTGKNTLHMVGLDEWNRRFIRWTTSRRCGQSVAQRITICSRLFSPYRSHLLESSAYMSRVDGTVTAGKPLRDAHRPQQRPYQKGPSPPAMQLLPNCSATELVSGG